MSRTISYRGKLPIGEQAELNLKTNKGKIGYQITKFNVIPSQPGQNTEELISQIYSTDQTGSITDNVDFSNAELMAVAFYTNNSNMAYSSNTTIIIFDNEKVNQNLFVTMTNAAGGTTPANYYIELEAMSLNDLEATQLTLKSIRTITS